jgi:hypothetical protein
MGEFGRGSETSEGAQPYKAFSGGGEWREQGPVEPARTDERRLEPIGDVPGPEPIGDVPGPVRRVREPSEPREIARIREQGQNAILISADGGSAEQVLIDPDEIWHYDERQVGGKVYLTRKHAEGDHLRKNPLASEMAGEEIRGPLSHLESGRASGAHWAYQTAVHRAGE